MDNYNGQNQSGYVQGNSYQQIPNGYVDANQYQQYQGGYVDANQYQQNVSGYENPNQYQAGYSTPTYYGQNNSYASNQNYVGYGQQVTYESQQAGTLKTGGIKKFISVGMILGLVSALLILIGLFMPAIDFSHFHQEIDIQYNIMKICKNVRLISPIWTALPVGIIIGIIFMFILSFVRIPQFRLIPCVLVLAMFIIMLADMNNIILWADNLLNGEMVQELVNQEFVMNKTEVFESIRSGIYLMVAGTLTGFVSSFLKPSSK